jgi:UDP-N-acetylmuramyl pentapeptide phosphotransferase/UDP-N-acetylglucosamine-1-phosphate transferase
MNTMTETNCGVVSVKANASRSAALRRSHNHPVRFWIITMMLVLVGLSTLKLR